MTASTCPVHHVALTCPSCQRSEAGATVTPAKRRAARRNGRAGGRPSTWVLRHRGGRVEVALRASAGLGPEWQPVTVAELRRHHPEAARALGLTKKP